MVTSLPLVRITALCGFADVHHFSARFRRDQGEPPGAYRWRTQTGRATPNRLSEPASATNAVVGMDKMP